MAKGKPSIVLQFRIELIDIEPTIWRRIQVPSKYTFWDLHVAIQDSMGWLDYHLHRFQVQMPHKKKAMEIGIPSDDFDDVDFLPGWEIAITDYFTEPGKSAFYEYDFGDGWEHNILLEAILLKEDGVSYPRCIAGERACPPEDCGGVPGYYELIKILKNPKHPEYSDYISWLEGHAKNYHPYDPDHFSPEDVEFWDPKKRWKMAFRDN
jgi:hypothetical protein